MRAASLCYREVNSGSVELTLQDAQGNPDPSLHLTASVQPDGSFHFDYIPGNATFTLKVTHAADVTTTSTKKMFGATIADQKINHAYGSASVVASVGDSDVTDLKIEVPELATK